MATERIIGDEWPINVGLTDPPDDWESWTWCVDIGPVTGIGGDATITIEVEPASVPAGEDYDGWLTGTVPSADTEGLTAGRYYMQLTRWDTGEPQSRRVPFQVIAGFDRTECGA